MLMSTAERAGKNNELMSEVSKVVAQIKEAVRTSSTLSQSDTETFISALEDSARRLSDESAEQNGLGNALVLGALKVLRNNPGHATLLPRLRRTFALLFPGVPGGAYRAADE